MTALSIWATRVTKSSSSQSNAPLRLMSVSPARPGYLCYSVPCSSALSAEFPFDGSWPAADPRASDSLASDSPSELADSDRPSCQPRCSALTVLRASSGDTDSVGSGRGAVRCSQPLPVDPEADPMVLVRLGSGPGMPAGPADGCASGVWAIGVWAIGVWAIGDCANGDWATGAWAAGGGFRSCGARLACRTRTGRPSSASSLVDKRAVGSSVTSAAETAADS